MTQLAAFLLPALPLLALLAALLLGRYPGCDAIVRLSEWIAARHAPPAGSTASTRRRRSPSFAAAGGLLLALSLSGRAPPATA